MEADAESRVNHAEDEAAQCRDEAREMAGRLRCQRRRAKRAEGERDQLRQQTQADADCDLQSEG